MGSPSARAGLYFFLITTIITAPLPPSASVAGCKAPSGAFAFSGPMRTFVYIDGFNLYYGALRKTPYRWLDMKALFQRMLDPAHQILQIRYFTARITARPGDPDAPTRQDTYLRALKAHSPDIDIQYGRFLSHSVSMPLVVPNGGQRFANVIKTEEKGSDVNIAVHLLHDAWHGRFDCGVIVSNDSDLAEALRIVKLEIGKKIGVFVPGDKSVRRVTSQLNRYANFVRYIGAADLAASQLPNPIVGTRISKPAGW